HHRVRPPADHPIGRRADSFVSALQAGALFEVALAAERLEVVDAGGAAAAERDDVVELQIVRGAALAALAAVALEDLGADVLRDGAGVALAGREDEAFGDATGKGLRSSGRGSRRPSYGGTRFSFCPRPGHLWPISIDPLLLQLVVFGSCGSSPSSPSSAA